MLLFLLLLFLVWSAFWRHSIGKWFCYDDPLFLILKAQSRVILLMLWFIDASTLGVFTTDTLLIREARSWSSSLCWWLFLGCLFSTAVTYFVIICCCRTRLIFIFLVKCYDSIYLWAALFIFAAIILII